MLVVPAFTYCRFQVPETEESGNGKKGEEIYSGNWSGVDIKPVNWNPCNMQSDLTTIKMKHASVRVMTNATGLNAGSAKIPLLSVASAWNGKGGKERERQIMMQWYSADGMDFKLCHMRGDSIVVKLSMRVQELWWMQQIFNAGSASIHLLPVASAWNSGEREGEGKKKF